MATEFRNDFVGETNIISDAVLVDVFGCFHVRVVESLETDTRAGDS